MSELTLEPTPRPSVDEAIKSHDLEAIAGFEYEILKGLGDTGLAIATTVLKGAGELPKKAPKLTDEDIQYIFVPGEYLLTYKIIVYIKRKPDSQTETPWQKHTILMPNQERSGLSYRMVPSGIYGEEYTKERSLRGRNSLDLLAGVINAKIDADTDNADNLLEYLSHAQELDRQMNRDAVEDFDYEVEEALTVFGELEGIDDEDIRILRELDIKRGAQRNKILRQDKAEQEFLDRLYEKLDVQFNNDNYYKKTIQKFRALGSAGLGFARKFV